MRGKIFIDCSGDGDLAALAGVPTRSATVPRNMLYPTMMFRLTQRRPRRGRTSLAYRPALMEAAEAPAAQFPRKGANDPADGASDRVARQFHPGQQRQRPRARRRRCRRALRRRDRRPAARRCAFFDFLSARRPALRTPTSSTSRRSSASARPAASRSVYQLTGDDVLCLRELCRHHRRQRLADRSACRGRRACGAGPRPARAASTTCPTACWCRPGCATSWSPAAAPA